MGGGEPYKRRREGDAKYGEREDYENGEWGAANGEYITESPGLANPAIVSLQLPIPHTLRPAVQNTLTIPFVYFDGLRRTSSRIAPRSVTVLSSLSYIS